MTTIACTASRMAADSLAADDAGTCSVDKIWRVPGGLLGVAGTYVQAYHFRLWLESGKKGPAPKMKQVSALFIDGTRIWCYDSDPEPYPLLDAYTVIGVSPGADPPPRHTARS